MRAIVSVIGKDQVGILAKVSSVCAQHKANIADVTQSILQDMFVMVMLVDLSKEGCNFSELKKALQETGEAMGMQIHVMHEDVFESMHHI